MGLLDRKQLSPDELALVRSHAALLESRLCCPDDERQCPTCLVVRGAYVLALEVEALRASAAGTRRVQVGTFVEHGFDDTVQRPDAAKTLVEEDP